MHKCCTELEAVNPSKSLHCTLQGLWSE